MLSVEQQLQRMSGSQLLVNHSDWSLSLVLVQRTRNDQTLLAHLFSIVIPFMVILQNLNMLDKQADKQLRYMKKVDAPGCTAL